MPKRAGKMVRPKNLAAPAEAADRAETDAWFQQAGAVMADEVLPGIEAFRGYMAQQQRKLEVLPFLDHVEGPQVMLRIARPDGKIIATLILEVTPAGVQPRWEAESTGRVKTRWTEQIRGGIADLTRDAVLEKLTEFYNTDFS